MYVLNLGLVCSTLNSFITNHTHTTLASNTFAGVGEEDKKKRVMEINSKLTPEEVVAKVMMFARDPDLDVKIEKELV